MRSPKSFSEQIGYFTFAQNTDTVDYLELAYVQALSIKCTQDTVNKYAVAVDAATKEKINDKHRSVFDYIIDIPTDYNDASSDWKLANEWQAWWLTPFKETIKLESDMLFTRDLTHWISLLQTKEVVLTTHIRDYEGHISRSRAYREMFDENNLPDVYNGFMYFRFGQDSMKFFDTARTVFQFWPVFRDELLKNCRDETPSTDLLYAVTAQLVGPETCTLPNSNINGFPTFTHMKGAINRLGVNSDWTKHYYAQLDDNAHLTVGFTRQMYPFHYYQKHFITDDIKQRYERIFERIKSGA